MIPNRALGVAASAGLFYVAWAETSEWPVAGRVALYVAASLVAAFTLLVGGGGLSPEELEQQHKANAAWFAGKEKEPGVHKLASGMCFKVLKAGDGSGKSPTVSDPCEVHYHGTLPSGKKFDSSVERGRPLTFAPNQVIAGWTEALQLMREGDKWEVYIPYNLAYGRNGMPPVIPPASPLQFTMELLKVKGAGKSAAAASAMLKDRCGKTHADL